LKDNIFKAFFESIRSEGARQSEEYPPFRVQGVIQSLLQRHTPENMYDLYETVFKAPFSEAIGAH
jgi:hypothetical protein